MKTRNKILLINLGILFLYTGILFAQINWEYSSHLGLGFLLGMLMLISIQAVINLVTSLIFFYKKKKEIAQSFLLSTVLIPLIGASSCFGVASFF